MLKGMLLLLLLLLLLLMLHLPIFQIGRICWVIAQRFNVSLRRLRIQDLPKIHPCTPAYHALTSVTFGAVGGH